ncbi:CesT family type III secretion system chaperone [Hydrogenophaga sp. XSHU_21]
MSNLPSQRQLRELLADINAALSGSDPIEPPAHDSAAQFDFEWAGQAVHLVFNPHASPPCVSMACPLGPVPLAQAEAVLRQLLRIAHLTATSGSTVGYSPSEQCLYLVNSLPLPRATARLVLDALAGLADLAVHWGENHFLDRDMPVALAGESGLV